MVVKHTPTRVARGGRKKLPVYPFLVLSCPLENCGKPVRSGGDLILVLKLLEILKVIKMKKVERKGSFLV